jgi:hypothetical protein
MTHRITNRRKLIAWAAVVVLMLAAGRTPTGQHIVVGALIEFVEITERFMQIPCWLMDHTRCFSLDRLDPTCPQCI